MAQAEDMKHNPNTPLTKQANPVWYYNLAATTVGTILGATHGYRKHRSVGKAALWGVAGAAFPFITLGIAFAQGFGKKRG
jgi:hypothetical protein